MVIDVAFIPSHTQTSCLRQSSPQSIEIVVEMDMNMQTHLLVFELRVGTVDSILVAG